MLPGRLALAPPSSFELLNRLLQGADPQAFPIGNAPVAMTVGEPRDAPPPFIAEINENGMDGVPYMGEAQVDIRARAFVGISSRFYRIERLIH